MTKEKRFNIYIQAIKDEKDKTLIGENMNERQAEKREMTGLMRIDRDNYFIKTEEVK